LARAVPLKPALLALLRDNSVGDNNNGIINGGIAKGGNNVITPVEPPYRLVTDPTGARPVIKAIDGAALIALDTETTGLDPRTGRARLLQLLPDTGKVPYIIDLEGIGTGALTPLFEALAGKTIVGHNLLFDTCFLHPLGFTPGAVADTMILSQLLEGTRTPKGHHSLAQLVQRELGRQLSKAEQASDWSASQLSPAQLAYAASDVAVLLPLHAKLMAKVKEAKLEQVAEIEMRCLPAVAWLSRGGVRVDVTAWTALAEQAEAESARLLAELDAAAPPKPDGGRRNWRSGQQLDQVFRLVGVTLPRTEKGNPSASEDALGRVDHPWARLLLAYKDADKRSTCFGRDWLGHVAPDGRVYADWKQIGSDAGRMSCSNPNLQQLPRGKDYRRCFTAPPGRVLVKADYSQIELRIAAKITGDAAMLDAYRRGEDLHVNTARAVLGVEEVTPEHRQLAKAVGFGLLFGMGPGTFRRYARSNYGVEMAREQAEEYHAAFFRTYPGLAAWHARAGREDYRHRTGFGNHPETRTLTGRRRLFDRQWHVNQRLNSPVQGTGADGQKLALALLWERRHQCPGAALVLAIHDEIVLEVDADQAEAVARWVESAMVDAMTPLLDPVPVKVEVRVARTWGGD
jgi:DNA polymerase-1